MDTIGIANEVIIQHVVAVAARKLPDGNISNPRDGGLLDINTTGVIFI